MKLEHVLIKNFKGIDLVEFAMGGEDNKTPKLTALLGDNGSGKTSILQAIALTLSLATRRTREMKAFNWHGFLSERVSSLGPTLVELKIVFDAEEIAITQLLFNAWQDALAPERRQTLQIVAPSQFREVTLRFEKGRVSSPQGFSAVNQFLGRYYIKSLKDTRPELREHFAHLGDIFWFDQHRNLGALMVDELSGEYPPSQSWHAGVEQLREYLVGWWGHHTTVSRRGRDLIEPLERLFQKIFLAPALSASCPVAISRPPGPMISTFCWSGMGVSTIWQKCRRANRRFFPSSMNLCA